MKRVKLLNVERKQSEDWDDVECLCHLSSVFINKNEDIQSQKNAFIGPINRCFTVLPALRVHPSAG